MADAAKPLAWLAFWCGPLIAAIPRLPFLLCALFLAFRCCFWASVCSPARWKGFRPGRRRPTFRRLGCERSMVGSALAAGRYRPLGRRPFIRWWWRLGRHWPQFWHSPSFSEIPSRSVVSASGGGGFGSVEILCGFLHGTLCAAALLIVWRWRCAAAVHDNKSTAHFSCP